MNERIRQLLEQAGVTYAVMPKDTVYEKFGELIVKECADYFSREGDRRFEVDGNWIAKTIKQHFGV
jgi:hypothetical protein